MMKLYWRFIPLAMLAGVLAFPLRVILEQELPDLPTHDKLDKGIKPEDTFYHWLKNLLTELFRADPRWWAQCMVFVVCVLLLIILFLIGR